MTEKQRIWYVNGLVIYGMMLMVGAGLLMVPIFLSDISSGRADVPEWGFVLFLPIAFVILGISEVQGIKDYRRLVAEEKVKSLGNSFKPNVRRRKSNARYLASMACLAIGFLLLKRKP